jgi:HSP20 family protein
MTIEAATEPQFGNMVRQMNKMMDQVQKGFFNFCPAETWTPPVNLYENDTVYLVCVDLSGVDKEKIDVTVVDGRLKLRGQREVPINPDGSPPDPNQRLRIHLMEIDHGPFCREVELPQDILHDRISASYRNGMLWIEIPKK